MSADRSELDIFEDIAKRRRAVRHFLPDPVPEELLMRLLDIARWAPSGYNLQPTHFVVVTDAAVREKLYAATMKQSHVREAPVVIAFTGDRRVYENNFEAVLKSDREAGAINDMYEAKLRKYVPLGFSRAPLGLGGIAKKLLGIPASRLLGTVPTIPAAEKRLWLSRQVSLSAMQFMLAATAANLATVPMEGFGEVAVKRALGIPRSHVVVMLVALGYAAPGKPIKTRLPLARSLHREKF